MHVFSKIYSYKKYFNDIKIDALSPMFFCYCFSCKLYSMNLKYTVDTLKGVYTDTFGPSPHLYVYLK